MSGESTAAETGADTTTTTTTDPQQPTQQPAEQQPETGAAGDTTDWKAEAEKWKALSRKNETAASRAQSELDKATRAAMSETEKAIAEAEARGKAAAAVEYGRQLAAAKLEAAAASKGIVLGEAADLIDVGKFVDEQGQVDAAGINAAVATLAKLAPARPGTQAGGVELNGGPGGPPRTYTRAQLRDPKFFAEHKADIMAAFREGRIKE